MAEIDFSGLTILDTYGTSRIPLRGKLGADELAEVFIDEWILIRDCRTCGRPQSCRTADPDSAHDRADLDLPCLQVETLVRNHVRTSYPVLERLTMTEMQSYLDAAYHFCAFVDSALWNAGLYMNQAVLDYYGDIVCASLPASFIRLRMHLDKAGSLLAGIRAFNAVKGLLLVEGEAERALLEELRGSHISPFLYLDVIAYGGASKRRPAKLELLVRREAGAGYEVFLQGDSDGRGTHVFSDLIAKGLVKGENVFAFRWDLETSIPPPVLARILVQLGVLPSAKRDELVAALEGSRAPAGRVAQQALGLSLSAHKVRIARALGRLLCRVNWRADPALAGSELASFVEFVFRIPH